MFQQQPDRVIQERIVVAPEASAPGQPSTSDYFRLKAREKELNEQMEELQDRREELSQQVNQKVGVDRAGIEGRITTLDQRLQQIEVDLSQTGREAAQAAPASIAEPQPRIIYRGNSDEDMIAAGFIGAFLAVCLLAPVLYRSWRRRRAAPAMSVPAIANERIDRMEQSIDSIAVEIERVSENQRFMTRLMTETQLAGTIAAVRGSTEAAKAAAERAANV